MAAKKTDAVTDIKPVTTILLRELEGTGLRWDAGEALALACLAGYPTEDAGKHAYTALDNAVDTMEGPRGDKARLLRRQRAKPRPVPTGNEAIDASNLAEWEKDAATSFETQCKKLQKWADLTKLQSAVFDVRSFLATIGSINRSWNDTNTYLTKVLKLKHGSPAPTEAEIVKAFTPAADKAKPETNVAICDGLDRIANMLGTVQELIGSNVHPSIDAITVMLGEMAAEFGNVKSRDLKATKPPKASAQLKAIASAAASRALAASANGSSE